MKKAIAAILADTHLKDDNIPVVTSIFEQATEIAIGLGLKQLDHAGDIFNSRKAQSQVTLDALDTILDKLNKAGLKLNVVVGNHDKTDYGSSVSFVKQFRYHPGVTIFNICGGRPLTDKIFLSYLSYFEDEVYIEHYLELVTNGGKLEKNVLLTHIGVSGAVMNNGTVISSENITPSLFADFDLTLIGHYHDAQVLAGGQIRYIGASLQHNFGELTGKGLTVLYDDLSTEIIPLKYPQFIKYEVSPKDISKSDIEDLKKEKVETGDNIRIVLTGTQAEIKSFNKGILIEAGLSVQNKTEDINRLELEQRVEAFDVKSLTEEFAEFCETNKLDHSEGFKYFEKQILKKAI